MGAADAMVGTTVLGKLRVLRRLGAGGLGAVYEVEHLMTHNRHAMKVLHARHAMSSDAVSRLVREAGVAGRVKSSRLVHTIDVGQLADGRTFLLMELLEGRTWRERLLAQRTLHPAEAVRLGLQVCEGLALAHAAGVIHRDLKPDNVYLAGDPGAEEVKLLDFGLAKNLPGFTDQFGALTVEGGMMGTPQYLSPEQGIGTGDVDGRADQYAVAVMLYESLTGRAPFVGSNIAEVIALIHEGRYPPIEQHAPHVAHGLAAVIERGMSREREQRYVNIEAFARALAPFAGAASGTDRTDEFASPVSSRPQEAMHALETPALPQTGPVQPLPTIVRPPITPVAVPQPPTASPPRWPWIALLVLLAALVLVGASIAGWLALRPRRPRHTASAPPPPAAENVAAPLDTVDAGPRPPADLPGIAPGMQRIARTLPTSLPDHRRTGPLVTSRADGTECIESNWASAETQIMIGVCDGLGLGDAPLFRRDLLDYGHAYYIRRRDVRGHPGRLEWIASTHMSHSEVEVGGRFRIVVMVTGTDDPEAAPFFAAQIDFHALARMASGS